MSHEGIIAKLRSENVNLIVHGQDPPAITFVDQNLLHEALSYVNLQQYRLSSMSRSRGNQPRLKILFTELLNGEGNIVLQAPYSDKMRSGKGIIPALEVFEHEHAVQWQTAFVAPDRVRSKYRITQLSLGNNEFSAAQGHAKPPELSFIIEVDQDRISRIEADLRFNYRKIEQLLLQSSQKKRLGLIERICGMCCFSHQIALVGGLEQAIRGENGISESTAYVRAFIAELERIINHLLWTSMSMMELGKMELFQTGMTIRKDLQLMQQIINGENLSIKILENHLTFSSHLKYKINKMLDDAEVSINQFHLQILSECGDNLRDKAVLSGVEARSLSAVGPMGRSSGLRFDIRQTHPYLSYGDMEVKATNNDWQGDLLSKVTYRIEEMKQSIRICQEALHYLPGAAEQIRFDETRIEPGEYISQVEAPAGALTYQLTIGEKHHLQDLHISIPTIINFPAILKQIVGSEVKYLSLVLKGVEMGIDPLQHIIFEDRNSQASVSLSAIELRKKIQQSFQYGSPLELFKDI